MTTHPLTVAIVDGVLTISIGIDTLARVTEACPLLEDDDLSGPIVVDKDLWAKEVALGLRDEQEDGTTPVHVMFDQVFERLAEDGAGGIHLPCDDE